MKNSTMHRMHINSIWNGATPDEIEARIEALPGNTIVYMGNKAKINKPAEIFRVTLALLHKYGITYVFDF